MTDTALSIYLRALRDRHGDHLFITDCLTGEHGPTAQHYAEATIAVTPQTPDGENDCHTIANDILTHARNNP